MNDRLAASAAIEPDFHQNRGLDRKTTCEDGRRDENGMRVECIHVLERSSSRKSKGKASLMCQSAENPGLATQYECGG